MALPWRIQNGHEEYNDHNHYSVHRYKVECFHRAYLEMLKNAANIIRKWIIFFFFK